MTDFTLILGDYNYSSWSLRPFFVARANNLVFSVDPVRLRVENRKAAILAKSPSGFVPALRHGDLTLWDSLAIIEYLADLYPEKGIWPAERAARAEARAISAEMHAGFAALRRTMPMDFARTLPAPPADAERDGDIARIDAIWRGCRERFAGGGPYLFGALSAADAMYAPVVSRFRTYGVRLSDPAQAYAEAIWTHPVMQEWLTLSRAEITEREGPIDNPVAP